MSKFTFIGIDPGLSGAIAKIEGNDIQIIPMPLYETKDTRKLNLPVIKEYFKELNKDSTKIMIEYASIGGFDFQGRTQGVASSYKIGFNYGQLLGLFEGLDMNYDVVVSHKWQKHLFPLIKTGSTKDRSIFLAKQLFPNVSLVGERGRVDNHNFADALLIAEYCRRINTPKYTWEALYVRE